VADSEFVDSLENIRLPDRHLQKDNMLFKALNRAVSIKLVLVKANCKSISINLPMPGVIVFSHAH